MPAGAVVGEYRVEASTPLLDKQIYLVQARGERFVLVESLEYFQPEYREEIFAAVAPILRAHGTPLEAYFMLFSDNLPMLYSVYGAECWPEAGTDLQSRLRQAGLFGPRELEAIYQWLRKLLQALWQAGYVNPGLIPPLIFQGGPGLYALEWEYCVPLDDSLQYPRMYDGYHSPAYLAQLEHLLNEKRRNQALAGEALYATLMELIGGRSPLHWSPQPISTVTFRFALSAPLRKWLEAADGSFAIAQLPAKLPGYYSSQPEAVQALSRSNQAYHAALPMLTLRQGEQARELLDTAIHTNFNDAFAFCALALLEQHAGRLNAFEEYLGRALQLEPLACFFMELAKGRAALGRPEAAIQALREAVKRFAYYPEAWFMLGQLLLQKKAFAQAEEALLRAWQLRKSPKYAKLLYDFFFEHGLEDQARRFTPFFNPSIGGKLQIRLNPAPETVAYLPPLEPGDELEQLRIVALLNQHQAKDCWNYLAEDEAGKRYFVREYARSARQRAKTEIYAVLVLRHPAIQPLAGVLEPEARGSTCLVYAQLAGESLEDRLRRTGRLTQAEAVEVLAGVGTLLQALGQHEPPLVHGDIKPANLFITSEGKVMLLDFESVRLLDASNEIVPYTYPYSPPELQAHYRLDASTDFYGLGMTLVHALTGVFPSEFVDIRAKKITGWEMFALHIAPEFRSLLADWLAWLPAERRLPSPEALAAATDGLRALPELPMSAELEAWRQAFARVYQSQTADEVLQAGTRLLEIRTQALSLRYVAGHYLRLGLRKDALKLGLRALQLDPGHVQTAWLVAQIYKDVKMYAQAVQVLLMSLEHCQDQPLTYVMLGQCYGLSQQSDLALAAYKKAETLPPANLDIQFELLGLLMERGAYAEARSRCEVLLRQPQLRAADKAELHLILGAIFGRQQRYGQALETLLQAQKLRPSPQLSYDIGLSLFHLRRFAEAAEAFRRRLASEPEHLPSQYFLGKALLELGQVQAALPWLLNLEKHPHRPDDVYFELGKAYTQLRDLPRALEMYLNAQRLMPDNPAVLVNLGVLRLNLGQSSEALQLARAALSQLPSLAQARELERLALQAS